MSQPLDRDSRPRLHTGAVRPARHADALRPRGRRDQGRTAQWRSHSLRHTEGRQPCHLLRPAERRQAQRQHRSRHRLRGGVGSRARRAVRCRRRELPARRDGPPRTRITSRCRARQPRLVYASITGYGSSGPWTKRRAYAPVVGAEAGITKAQGDARGSAYTNDPFSHADVYTALEAAVAILAACTAASRPARDAGSTSRWRRRCCTSTSTSTTNSSTVTSTRAGSAASHPATTSSSPRRTVSTWRSADTRPSVGRSSCSSPPSDSTNWRRRSASPAFRRRMENFAELGEHIARVAATFADATALRGATRPARARRGQGAGGTRAGRVSVGG